MTIATLGSFFYFQLARWGYAGVVLPYTGPTWDFNILRSSYYLGGPTGLSFLVYPLN